MSWVLFQGLFFVAALVAVFATFFAVSSTSPLDPMSGATPWLLGINFLLIAVLAVIVMRAYLAIRNADAGEGKGRLARRFVLLFGFSAIIPASIVALFLGATITQGLDNWYGARVDTIMDKTASILRDDKEEFENTLMLDISDAARDVERFSRTVNTDHIAPALETGDPETIAAAYSEVADAFDNVLSELMTYRGFQTIALLGPDGHEIIAQKSQGAPLMIPPPPSAFEDADKGESANTLYEARGFATSLFRIDEPTPGYIYGVKGYDASLSARLRDAEAAIVEYRGAKQRGGRLQTIFIIGYAQITALILLLSGRLGLEAAGRITGPIGRLAAAAHSVRDGDLTVRVAPSGPHDEVYALSNSFNAMTEQLGEQRNAVMQAREDAEDRRQFVETLLAEVSAGIIRTDGSLVISLANRSACDLIGLDHIDSGSHLIDIAPQFERYARDTLERNAPIDASIDFSRDGETLNIRLKTALDPAGGCVLTFDDMTRLVSAQRQLAWRDVARRIAHEIRNPLTPIMLSTERLKRRYGAKIADDDMVFNLCIDTILRQVGDIGRMVEEFSSFARMPKPNVAPFDMKSLLQGAGFSQSMVSPDVQIHVHTTLETATYFGDERLLSQAIGNLVKNAAEAIEGMPEEAEVQGRIDLSLHQEESGFEIIIEDNGPGFPDAMRERLLEPYVTTREKGTGLGLAIVNRIIVDHGGSISLQNRFDGLRGARVKIVLPYPDDTPELISPVREHETAPVLSPKSVEEPA